MNVAVIDWGSIVHKCWHSMAGKNPKTFDSEPKEWTYRVANMLLELKTTYKWDKCFLAMDSKPYWRLGWLQEYSEAQCKVWRDETGTLLYEFDNNYHTYEYEIFKKVKKAEVDPHQLTKVPREEEDVTGYNFPSYKGIRNTSTAKDSWHWNTSRGEFSRLISSLGPAISGAMGAVCLQAEGVEADDFACVISEMLSSKHTLTLFSGDYDWLQLITDNDNVEMYDTRIAKMWTLDDEAEIIEKTWGKIIGGDDSDGICGTWKIGAATKIGTAGALKLLKSVDNNPEELIPILEPNVFKRNYKMVRLTSEYFPEEITELCKKTIKEGKVSNPKNFTWENFFIHPNAVQALTAQNILVKLKDSPRAGLKDSPEKED